MHHRGHNKEVGACFAEFDSGSAESAQDKAIITSSIMVSSDHKELHTHIKKLESEFTVRASNS